MSFRFSVGKSTKSPRRPPYHNLQDAQVIHLETAPIRVNLPRYRQNVPPRSHLATFIHRCASSGAVSRGISMLSFTMLNETRIIQKTTLSWCTRLLRNYTEWPVCMKAHAKPSQSSTSCTQLHSSNSHKDTIATFPFRRIIFLNQSRHKSLPKTRISAGNLCIRLAVKGNAISMSHSTLSRCHNLTITNRTIPNTTRTPTSSILSILSIVILVRTPSTSNTSARNSPVITPMIHTSRHHPSALRVLAHLVTSTQDPPKHIGNLHSSRIRRKEALCITNPRTMIISTKTSNKPKFLHPVRNIHRLPSSICKRRGSHLMFTSARRVDRRRTRTFSAHPDLCQICAPVFSFGHLASCSTLQRNVYHYCSKRCI